MIFERDSVVVYTTARGYQKIPIVYKEQYDHNLPPEGVYFLKDDSTNMVVLVRQNSVEYTVKETGEYVRVWKNKQIAK